MANTDKNQTVLGGQEVQKPEINTLSNQSSIEHDDLGDKFNEILKSRSTLSITPESYVGQVPLEGISRNVSPYAYTPAIDEREQMAWGQPTMEKIALAFPRAATTALESIASIPGAIVGLGDWAIHGFNSDEFANAFSNGLLTAVS